MKYKDYMKMVHEIAHKQSECFGRFMREAFGYDDYVYPSDVLLDWSWFPVDAGGRKVAADDPSQTGIFIKGTMNGTQWIERMINFQNI